MEETGMLRTKATVGRLARTFVRDTRAQDAFEYLLVIGGVSVVIVGAVATNPGGLIQPVIDGVLAAITSLLPVP